MTSIIIDLSYGIFPEMSKYPSDPAPRAEITAASLFGGKYSSAISDLTLRPHHGTHIDAPAHKIPRGKTIDQYPLKKFLNQACLVDLTEDRSSYVQEITPALLEKHLTPARKARLQQEKVAALLLRTGYDQKIIQGTNNQADFPYFTEEAAVLLADCGLPLNIVGMDSFAFDKKGSNSEAHRIFLSRDVLLLETLVNLDCLKKAAGENSFMLHSAPVIYRNVDAAQTRAYAFLTEIWR